MQAQPNILIVDDVPENLSVLGELLQPTYRVRAARNGKALMTAHQRDQDAEGSRRS